MKEYLDLLKDIKENGIFKGDRTGTGTQSVICRQLRFDLRKGFPLLTTKRVYWKGVVHELLWFLSGSTNIKYLTDNDVHIWDAWATEDGELGPIYGKQWTDWECTDGFNVNQIDYVINAIKNTPNSRRILFHAWNPEFIPDESSSPQDNVKAGYMSLTPCHLLYQFFVEEGVLHTQLYIRSSDVFLGLPFNIASVALLTKMIASITDLEAGEIIINTGDTHIYNNLKEQTDEQLTRVPSELPTVEINPDVKSIYYFTFDDIKLLNYNPQPAIKGKVSV